VEVADFCRAMPHRSDIGKLVFARDFARGNPTVPSNTQSCRIGNDLINIAFTADGGLQANDLELLAWQRAVEIKASNAKTGPVDIHAVEHNNLVEIDNYLDKCLSNRGNRQSNEITLDSQKAHDCWQSLCLRQWK
jgi:hypothetical protein